MCITSSKTLSKASQLSREANNKDQSKKDRYLPISAFRLGHKSRWRMNLSRAEHNFLAKAETDIVYIYCDQIDQRVERSVVYRSDRVS